MIIGQAKLLFRSSLVRVAHVWLLATLLIFDDAFLAPRLGRFPSIVWVVVSAFVWIWIGAAATRGLMHDRRFVWSLDGDFWRYFGATIVLWSPLTLIGAVDAFFPLPRAIVSIASIVVVLLLIRFSLWPIGLVLGYRQMTASESAQLMAGRVLSLLGAGLIVGVCLLAPVLILMLIVVLATTMSDDSYDFGLVAIQVGSAIASVITTIAGRATLVAMYKLTAEFAEAGTQDNIPL